MISGVLNIAANVFFVTVCRMTVEGVAIATVLSSAVALTLVLMRLFRSKGICRVRVKYLRIGKVELAEIVRVGIPTCLCSLFFYAANVILSSAVNSMSTEAMTANAISSQFDAIIYTVGAAIASATSVMVSQNFGAGQLDRIRKVMRTSVIYVTAVSLCLGSGFVLLAEPMLGILSDDPNVIAIAKDRMTLLCLTYFVISIMEVFSFSLRALKRQKSTMVVGAICGFGIRCLWCWLVWPLHPTLSMLFACYAISGFVAIAIYLFVYRDALKSFTAKNTSIS
jgi:Na+-driven multidrug efflux pump